MFQVFHPDIAGVSGAEMSALINSAYTLLSDDKDNECFCPPLTCCAHCRGMVCSAPLPDIRSAYISYAGGPLTPLAFIAFSAMAPKLLARRPAGHLKAGWRDEQSGALSIWEFMEHWQEGPPGQRAAALLAPGHLMEIVLLSDGGRTM
eukprot:5537711-Amphidinium_carterae.1